jgi:hypothetical protein
MVKVSISSHLSRKPRHISTHTPIPHRYLTTILSFISRFSIVEKESYFKVGQKHRSTSLLSANFVLIQRSHNIISISSHLPIPRRTNRSARDPLRNHHPRFLNHRPSTLHLPLLRTPTRTPTHPSRFTAHTFLLEPVLHHRPILRTIPPAIPRPAITPPKPIIPVFVFFFPETFPAREEGEREE